MTTKLGERSLSGRPVLVTGVGGRLGAELVLALRAAGAIVSAVGRADFDLGGREGVLEAVVERRPEVIFHAAAWTAVDGCEEDPDTAYRVNALGTRNVCEAAERAGSRVVYLSSDYVFSGNKGSPYDEFDEPDPISVYGRSKLWGERYVQRLGPAHVVVRTSRLFGGTHRNYVVAALDEARGLAPGEPFVAISDQLAIPTYVPDLAVKIVEIAEHGGGGVYHVTSSGSACSWAELAEKLFEIAHLAVPVRAVASSERPRRAPRPKNGVLANRVLYLEGVEPLPPWPQALERYVRVATATARGAP